MAGKSLTATHKTCNSDGFLVTIGLPRYAPIAVRKNQRAGRAARDKRNMLSVRLTRFTLRVLDSAARVLPGDKTPDHLLTGRRGEEEAYFHLRKLGYVMVARNYRSPRSRSELDLVGWDKDTLCFIEVKTRTTRAVQPAEAAVDPDKQKDLAGVAREFMRKVKGDPRYRFDIVSVYLAPDAAPDITLFRDAFSG